MTTAKFTKGTLYMYDNQLVLYRGKHNGVFMFNVEVSTGLRINIVDPTMVQPAPSGFNTKPPAPAPKKPVKKPTSKKQALIVDMKHAYDKWTRSKGNISLLTNQELILSQFHCLMPKVDFVKLEKKLAECK